jgi:WD40 repeat protein
MQLSRRKIILSLGAFSLASLVIGCGDEQQNITVPRTTTLSWSPDGTLLAWGKPDGKIEVRDEGGEQIRATYRKQKGGIASLAWSPDGTLLASGSHDKSVHIWEAQTGKQITVSSGYQGPVVGLGWSANGKRLVSIDSTQAQLHWQTPGESAPSEQQDTVTGTKSQLNVAAFSARSPDAGYVAGYGKSDGFVTIQWFLEDPQAKNASCGLRAHVGPGQSTLDVAWSPDGQYLAASGLDRRITIWRVGTCSSKTTYEKLDSPAVCLAWAPDGQSLAAGIDQGVQIFHLGDTKQASHSIKKHNAFIRAIAWSSKNRGASVDEKQVLQVWEVKNEALAPATHERVQ